MDEFCGSPLWDTEKTWYTEDPDFTPCFEKTVLVWIPCGFLWLFCSLDIYYSLQSKSKCIPWTGLNGLKFAMIMLLIIAEIIMLLRVLVPTSSKVQFYQADIYQPVVKLLTYILAIGLLLFAKFRGVRSSGVQFVFWLLLTICEAFKFRTLFVTPSQEHADVLIYIMTVIYFPFVVGLFVLSCWSDSVLEDTPASLIQKNPCPEESSSFVSRLFFHWFNGLSWKGFRQPLEYSDLWNLNTADTSRHLVARFDKYWSKELRKKERAQRKRQKNQTGYKRMFESTMSTAPVKLAKDDGDYQCSILRALVMAIAPQFFFGAVLKIIPDLLVFISPHMLELLIEFVESNEEMWKGIFYAVMMLLSAYLQSILMAQYSYRMYMTGLRIRTILVSAIYRKALLVGNAVRRESTVGEIVNLMSVDVQKMMDCVPFINLVWSAPLQIGLALYFLWEILGPSSLAGLVVMLLLIPVNALIAAKAKVYQVAQMEKKDHRVKLMSEILSGIKVLKLYAWEPSFERQVKDVRGAEVKVLQKAAYLNAVSNFLWSCSSFIVAAVTFATFVLVDPENVLDAKTAFVSLSLFNVMSTPLTYLALIILQLVQAAVSLGRINKFMNAEEIDPKAVSHDESEVDPIVIKDGCFAWEPEAMILKGINLTVKEGSLVAIVGSVGCGKSTLLSAILGECNRVDGYVNTKGSIGYVAQQAWIQNASLRDNILFGRAYNAAKYDKVISACALQSDLEILPAGDKTEIGEKGINLSGGQKQRVGLARAAYGNADIYLFDDPLSAVDPHVGKHIFDKVIGPRGLLRKKTRVLVTHGISYLPYMSDVIVMRDGEIIETGTYKDLIEKKGAFAEFLSQQMTSEDVSELEGTPFIHDIQGVLTNMSEIKSRRRRDSSVGGSEVEALATESISSRNNSFSKKSKPQDYEEISRRASNSGFELEREIGEQLIEVEKPETESVKLVVYFDYFRAAGWGFTFATFFLYCIYQGLSIGSNFWLSAWSNQAVLNQTEGEQKKSLYLGVYGGFGVLQALAVLSGSIAMAHGTLNSSKTLHNKMLTRILQAPMSFFDTTPLGRIVNRFARDVDICDTLLPLCLRFLITAFFQVVATLIIISYNTPLFVTVILPITVFYYFIQGFYVNTSRQLKRLESVTRSPIYSHFGETLSGAPTIRAYGEQDRFIAESEARVDYNQMAYFPAVVANRWLSIRLESIGNTIVFFAALFAVLGRDTLSSGLVGLSVSYALQITTALMMLVRWSAETETNIVAVERLKEYGEAPQEAPRVIPGKKPPKNWPEHGVVEFDHYQTKYRPELDFVLKDVTCTIQSGEKIGIVGRTGAGKSSLTLALFRIVEATHGKISIDGVNISEMGLHDIRGRITVIPQDPALFSGDLRMNLDPFELHSDDVIWNALELAHLKSYVQSLPAGLHHEISEGGENLSVGQRQLVCLARALLRKTKILVLDEATAAVDLETDNLIQQTIRHEFKDSTIITIAHRLNTILDSTRVIVLDKGEIREFDTPENLLRNKNSIFYGMASDAGIVSDR